MKFINIFLLLLFKTKYVFLRPKKSKILLYDQGKTFNQMIKNTLNTKKDISVMYVRLEEVNLYVLFSCVVKFRLFNSNKIFFNYLVEYCRIVNPRWIVTSTHYDLKFFRLREVLKDSSKFIIVQCMPAYKNHFKHFEKKYSVDAVFCYDSYSKKIYAKKIRANYIKIGSFKNNFYPVEKNKKNCDILLISGFKDNFLKQKKIPLDGLDLNHEKKLTNYLIEYSASKDLKFKILLKPDTKKDGYINFNNISKKYLINNTSGNPYSVMDKSALILISNYSAMSFEAAARGLKHALIVKHKHPKNKFYKDNFFTYKKEIKSSSGKIFLDNLFIQSKKNFFLNYKKAGYQAIFDKKNKTFKSFINNN